MTLTSLLPTLRDSIPSPFDRGAWPAGAAPLLDDVTVSAVSLRRYAEICGTPCVCTGPAVIPYSGGTASPTESTTVVITTIVAVDAASVRLDACFGDLEPVWREARLLGRVSHAYEEPFAVFDAHAVDASATIVLPGDPQIGDRIAVPLPGCHSVGEIRAARSGR